jgi:hypothetical protein
LCLQKIFLGWFYCFGLFVNVLECFKCLEKAIDLFSSNRGKKGKGLSLVVAYLGKFGEAFAAEASARWVFISPLGVNNQF